MLGLKAISFWVGTCDTRGQGPPAQWLSLPFYAPEGAWRLSWQIPGIHRGLPKGRSLWIRDQAELYRLSVYGASSDFSKSPSNCQALVARPRLRHQSRRRRHPRRQRRRCCRSLCCRCRCYLWSSASVAELLPPSPRTRPKPAAETKGGGFVVDLPYQMHNNYESGEI